MEQNERITFIGKFGSGKSRLGERLRDEWLMRYPGKKCLILDTKADKRETRWFEPHLAIAERKEDGKSV